MGLVTTLLRNKRLTFGVVAAVGVGAYVYFAWIPDSLSHDYVAHLKPVAADIKTVFGQVSKGLDKQIFNTPDMPIDARRRDLDALRTLNDGARKKLDALAVAIPKLQKAPPGAGFFGQYSDAFARQTHSFAILSQSRDVIDNYDTLISFLQKYYEMQSQVDAALNDINAVPDTNLLIGQASALNETAQRIYGYAAELKELKTPTDFKDFQQKAVAHFENTARGFEQIAYGVSIVVDAQTYAGIRLVEAAAREHDDISASLFALLSETSATIRSILDLPAKADSLLSE